MLLSELNVPSYSFGESRLIWGFIEKFKERITKIKYVALWPIQWINYGNIFAIIFILVWWNNLLFLEFNIMTAFS